jgi:hypothetical protein
MNYVTTALEIIGAIKVIATALAPLFPVGSKTAWFLNWVGIQLKGLKSDSAASAD